MHDRFEGEIELKVNTANPTVSTASDAFVRAADGAAGWEGQVWDQTVLLKGAPVSYENDPWLRRPAPGIPAEKLAAMREHARPLPADATDEYAQTPGFSVRALAEEARRSGK